MTYPDIKTLMGRHAHAGRLEWIGVRPERGEPMLELNSVEVSAVNGLVGDRFAASRSKRRQVTLIQHEHLMVIAEILGVPDLGPELLRRNLVVSGINLLALKDKAFSIGEVRLKGTGLSHPCSKMESTFGPGGYNAVRGHGGITASVELGGLIKNGDVVQPSDSKK